MLAIHAYRRRPTTAGCRRPTSTRSSTSRPATRPRAAPSTPCCPYYEQGNLFNQCTQDIPNPGYLTAQYRSSRHPRVPVGPDDQQRHRQRRSQLCHRQLRLEPGPVRRQRHFQCQGRLTPPYRIGTIPDGSSNTIGIVEASGCFPGYPAVDPQTGTSESYMTWHWPAYPNRSAPTGPTRTNCPARRTIPACSRCRRSASARCWRTPTCRQCYHHGHERRSHGRQRPQHSRDPEPENLDQRSESGRWPGAGARLVETGHFLHGQRRCSSRLRP